MNACEDQIYMKNIMRFVTVFFVLAMLCTSSFAQSQSTTGLIQGTVVDPNGAIVSGATVTVRNVNTGFERTVTSNSDGLFTAPLLPLGTYRVTTSASGFSNSVLENVEVTIGNTLTLNIGLKVGGATETVDVSSEADAIDTARTELSTQINQRSVENLPINRRDFSRSEHHRWARAWQVDGDSRQERRRCTGLHGAR